MRRLTAGLLVLTLTLFAVACSFRPAEPAGASDTKPQATDAKTDAGAETGASATAAPTEATTKKPDTPEKPERSEKPEVPSYSGGTLKGEYQLENGNEMKRYEKVAENGFADYRKQLTDAGYTLYDSHEIGANRYATLTKSDSAVSLCYIAADNSLTVTVDLLERTALYPREDYDGSTKVTDTTLGIISLNYAMQGGKKDPETGENLDGNGMSFVITLEDGRYIVIDGGYDSDVSRLRSYLRDNNKRTDGIKIAAWIMTHSHPDHYGCLDAFYFNCASWGIEVEYVIANPVPESRQNPNFAYEAWMRDKLPKIVERLGAKYVMPHAGQVLRFCNAELEILYTHENMAPELIWNPNEASTVFRLKADGKSVLFLGDVEFSTPVLTKMYGAELKSDIVQINHHGYAGGSQTETAEELRLIDPSIAIWTTSRATFDLRRSASDTEPRRQPFRDLIDKIGLENCLIADGPCKLLPMKYTSLADMTTYEFPTT